MSVRLICWRLNNICFLASSDVAAAYAHFLWEIEDDEEEVVKQDNQIEVHAWILRAGAENMWHVGIGFLLVVQA